MKKFKSSFFAKLFVTYFLVAMIPLVIITVLLYGFSEKRFIKNIEDEAARYLKEVTAEVDQLYAFHSQAIMLLSNDPLVKKVMKEQKVSDEEQRLFYEKMFYLFSGRTNRMSLYVLGMDGKVLFHSDDVPSHYDTRDYLNWGVLRKASDAKGNVVFHQINQVDRGVKFASATAAMALTLNKKITGFILVDIGREEFSNIIATKTSGNIWDVHVINDIGNVLYSKNERALELMQLKRDENYNASNDSGQYTVNKEQGTFHASYLSSRNFPYKVLSYSSLDEVRSNVSFLLQTLAYVGILTLIISALVAYRVSKSLSGTVNDLVAYMKKVETGDFSERFTVERTDEIGELMVRYNKMAKRLELLIQNIIESKDRLKKSEMKMLQSQINPHFLYNTLDTAKWMAKMHGAEDVSNLITNLALLLRISMEDAEEFQTVSMSIMWLESYLSIQKARYDDSLVYRIQVEEELMECSIPKLILQPLVENAIIHGLEHQDGKGELHVSGYLKEGIMTFEVKDNGIGMAEEVKNNLLNEGNRKGIGLINVHRRIELLYGKGFGLKIFSEMGKGTTVRIDIPEGGLV